MFECSVINLNCKQFVSLHMMLFMLFYTTTIRMIIDLVNNRIGGKGGCLENTEGKSGQNVNLIHNSSLMCVDFLKM